MTSQQRMSSIVSAPPRKNESNIDTAIVHDAQLANFGYEQELKRSFSLIGMIGFAFSIVTSWTALGGVLIIGISAGGPPVMVWSWLSVCLFSLCVAYSFAEMCSAYPLAGGQYSWTAILAPPKYARALAWATGILAMGAVNNFVGANFILAIANLNHPDYVIQRWQTVLLCYLFSIIAATINIFGSRWLNKISTGVLCWNILSFITITITMLATKKDKQPAKFVFAEFQNNTGFSSAGMAVMIGLLQSLFGMCCYDAPSKMVEEMKSPEVEAPKAIIAAVYIGTVTGFVFLVSAFFCIGDFETVADTSTGVPLVQIFYDATQSRVGASVMASQIAIICIFCATSLMAEGSRGLFAFSRDRGLPFSKVFATVDRKTFVPIHAVVLCTAVQMVFNSIYFGSYTGFSTVISISVFGFYVSYGMPLASRLITYFTTGHAETLPGPYSLGKWGIWMNASAVLFISFSVIVLNFPQMGPVDADNMNYCSAAFGVIGLISLLTWIFDGRKNFTGPETAIGVPNAVVAEEKGLSLGVGDADTDGSQDESLEQDKIEDIS